MTLSLRWFLNFSCLLWTFVLLTHPVQAQQACPTGYPLTTPNSDFTSAGNGMVQHTPTGLIWKRCAEGQSWNGSTCTGAAATYSWQAAFQRVDEVNAAAAGTENLGQIDWRVPNVNELKSLVEEGCYGPAINLTQFPNTPASFFWSASPFTKDSGHAWSMGFNYGYDGWDYRSNAIHVRLVRAGQSFLNFDAGTAGTAGTVTVSKIVTGAAANLVPAGTDFPIKLTCGAVILTSSATTAGPAVFGGVPVGTCTVSETPPAINGVTWGAPSYSPSTVAVTAGITTPVTVTNTANPSSEFTLTVGFGGMGDGKIYTKDSQAIYCVRSGGSISGDCSKGFPSGTQLTLSADPLANSYSSFSSWSGCDNQTSDVPAKCIVTINTSKNVVATFTRFGVCAPSTIEKITYLDLGDLPNRALAETTHMATHQFNVTCKNGRFGVVRFPGLLPVGALANTKDPYALVKTECPQKSVSYIWPETGNPTPTQIQRDAALANRTSCSGDTAPCTSRYAADPIIRPLASWICE